MRASSGAIIRASILTPLLEALKQNDSGDALMERVGLSRSHLGDPYSPVPLSRYIALFEESARALEAPTLGARLGPATKVADIGPLGLFFLNAKTLRVAFTRLSHHFQALQGSTQVSLQDFGEISAWSYKIEDATLWPRRQDAEYTLAVCCASVREGLGAEWSPLEVHLEHGESEHRTTLERLFRTTVRFRQPANRLLMTTKDLDRPFRHEDLTLSRFLERHLGDLAAEFATEPGLCQQVKVLIAAQIGLERITLKQLAQDLNCSERTLQRELARNGTSLRHLLRGHRETIAQARMSENGMSVASVAHALGYADSTAFWRAFKSWTGTSPSQFRRSRPSKREG